MGDELKADQLGPKRWRAVFYTAFKDNERSLGRLFLVIGLADMSHRWLLMHSYLPDPRLMIVLGTVEF